MVFLRNLVWAIWVLICTTSFASRNDERDTTTCSSHINNIAMADECFDKIISDINSHFTWLHQILKDKNNAILDKLGEKRSEFVELEAARLEQIEEIETMKQQLLNVGVKFNKTNVLRDKSIKDYEDALNGLRNPIQIQNIIFEKYSVRFQTLISSIDLMLVEDYTNKINPIISIDRDSILQSINAIGNVKNYDDKKIKVERVNLFRSAFDSETDRIFVLNIESKNILVFQQDGTLIACLKEEFKDLTDICVDTNNRLLYVLDGENCLYKFNIATHQLLEKKENTNTEKENSYTSLDVHNDEIYVGTTSGGIHVFSSELEHIRYISTDAILIVDILCIDEEFLIYSILPAGLNAYSYNGDSTRNIPLSLVFGMKEIEMLVETDTKFIPMQFNIDNNGLILYTNPLHNILCIQKFGGHLVHKIDILPEEDTNAMISGVRMRVEYSCLLLTLSIL